MEDELLFSEKGISVTKTRVMIGNDTYALSNITSCKVRLRKRVDKKKVKQQNIIAVVSFFGGSLMGTIFGIVLQQLGVSHESAAWCGIILAFFVCIFGLLKAIFIKTKYESHVLAFGLSSGEIEALEDRDSILIQQIHSAVNKAIVSRG